MKAKAVLLLALRQQEAAPEEKMVLRLRLAARRPLCAAEPEACDVLAVRSETPPEQVEVPVRAAAAMARSQRRALPEAIWPRPRTLLRHSPPPHPCGFAASARSLAACRACRACRACVWIIVD